MTDADAATDPLTWDVVQRWLASSKYYWVVTSRPDGRPHNPGRVGCLARASVSFHDESRDGHGPQCGRKRVRPDASGERRGRGHRRRDGPPGSGHVAGQRGRRLRTEVRMA